MPLDAWVLLVVAVGLGLAVQVGAWRRARDGGAAGRREPRPFTPDSPERGPGAPGAGGGRGAGGAQ